ncbi:MAG: hypothetical protein JWO08_823 [Verrucomicrobiaceae bacterium]|nr:hypothetical protein [Verrucomicrobiaceae bacterium]
MAAKPSRTVPLPRRYFKEVRFRQIRALVELSRQHSFAGTASALGLSVPSVWQQVRALEDEYGVPLVTATGTQVILTADGQRLVDLAAPLVEGFDSLRELFTEQLRQAPRHLTVVAPAPMLGGALRSTIIRYRKLHPDVQLTLIDRPSQSARQVMEEDGADLAVVGVALGDAPMPQFQAEPLGRYAFQLICPETHALATMKRISLAQIVRHPLVLSGEDSSSTRQIRHIFNEAGLGDQVQVTMTATNRALLLSYVAIGFGIAIGTTARQVNLPKPGRGEAALVVRDLTPLFGHEEVVILHRKGRHEAPHVKAFREMVQKPFTKG